MKVMQEWKLKPSEWQALGMDDRAAMIAYIRTREKMAGIEQHEANKPARKGVR